MRRVLLFVSLVLLAAVSLPAAETTAAGGITISQFKLGPHLDGPQLTLDDAKGKAVLIDEWGVHCGPCLASLPDIEKISRRYKDKMIVFGAHAQSASDEEVKAVVKKNRLSYTITNNMRSPVQVGTIPHVYLFDPNGSLIFHGHPADKEFEKMLRKAVAGPATAGGSTTTGTGLDALKRPSGLDALKKPGT